MEAEQDELVGLLPHHRAPAGPLDRLPVRHRPHGGDRRGGHQRRHRDGRRRRRRHGHGPRDVLRLRGPARPQVRHRRPLPPERRRGSSNAMLIKKVRKFKDGQGQYLWQPPSRRASPRRSTATPSTRTRASRLRRRPPSPSSSAMSRRWSSSRCRSASRPPWTSSSTPTRWRSRASTGPAGRCRTRRPPLPDLREHVIPRVRGGPAEHRPPRITPSLGRHMKLLWISTHRGCRPATARRRGRSARASRTRATTSSSSPTTAPAATRVERDARPRLRLRPLQPRQRPRGPRAVGPTGSIALYDAWVYTEGMEDPFEGLPHVAGWVPVDHYPSR
jgi:hypothetical protein